MCRERKRTRDRLLEYDQMIVPFHPRAAGLATVYPWENTSMIILVQQLYTIAANSGFTGTKEEFQEHFGAYLSNSNTQIIFAPFVGFPAVGSEHFLYFSTDTKILYYYDEEYIPVNAMLITDTIINGGEA